MSSSAVTADGLMQKPEQAHPRNAVRETVVALLQPLASLKLTCVLFLLALMIVFVGSLAQARRDVWQVMDQYFRTYLAHIDVADFFPPSMFPGLMHYNWDQLGRFRYIPFPGGWTIGWIMLANLLAAHGLKFRIRAQGMKLAGGLATIVAGLVMMTAVILTGNEQTSVEFGNYVLSPDMIWNTLLGVLLVAGGIPVLVGVLNRDRGWLERTVLATIGTAVLAVFLYFAIGGDAVRPNLWSMRILWQLLKGAACSLVLLLGCQMLFDKRGGIALLHFGVAMLMFSELQVGLYAKENMLTLAEGETTHWLRDIREAELAIVESLDDGKERVVSVPQGLLQQASKSTGEDQIVRLDELPFNIAVRNYYQNSRLRPVLPDDQDVTPSGLGSFATPVELDPVTGMDDTTDQPAVRIDLIARDSGKTLSSLLVAQNVSELRGPPIAEIATVDGRRFEFYLRYQRNYRPWQVELVDVSSETYVGSSTPKDYRSTIIIRDRDGGAPEEFTLWMNNPLRYRGETFYQTGYQKAEDGREITTLSVVRNQGWMLPYIACMLVAFGMFGQFWQTLSRYLRRVERQGAAEDAANESALEAAPPRALAPVVVPAILVLLFALSFAWTARKATAAPPADQMNLNAFAKTPVAWNGRPQPVDSFARTQLLMISGKSQFEGELDPAELTEKRADILAAFGDFWPNIKADSLADFEGTYAEWIAEMSRLTSSGEAAVEERMRSIMAQRRRPALLWFLDVVARPHLAERHRVIRIEDDQVLSLLDLQKRPGLTYSLHEIRGHLDDLEPINRESIQMRMDGQENRMSTLQRRVGALFDTVSRIDSLRNMYLMRETASLVDALVDSWRILRILGDKPAVMGVPTGMEEQNRSWETVVAANSLLQLRGAMQKFGLTSLDEIPACVETEVPRLVVSDALIGSYRILQEAVAEEAAKSGQPVAEDALKQRAAGAAAGVQDPFLRKILQVIADAEPGVAPEAIVAGLTPVQTRTLAFERISESLFEIFGTLQQSGEADSRLQSVREKLQKLGTEDEQTLGSAMNTELARLAVEDLQQRAGHLLNDGPTASLFQKNTEAVTAMLTAWGRQDVEQFNSTAGGYLAALNTETIPHLQTKLLGLETWFNRVDPFSQAQVIYLCVILLSFIGWLIWPKTLHRSGTWLLVLAFVIHTAALGMRMSISGRPPVTNLYSSAIFIGWAVVGASVFLEIILKNGIGNVLGAAVGAATLIIAHYLARDEGDTIGVMQAVLDTTFWLATHVVCITLGYAATFLAGAIGLAYCVKSVLGRSPSLAEELKKLGALTYGVLCFALFFSLVGTVLGGLWADDSWGRFWGWDPKENGAMMIVIWNALILHARWDRMVRDYGTAVLAMVGNIVTAWSWFGVNELKAGLHTYGFTEGRLLALALFAAVQVMIIAAALILYRRPQAGPASPA